MQALLVECESVLVLNQASGPKKLSTLELNRERRRSSLNAMLDVTSALLRQWRIPMTCQCAFALEEMFEHGGTSYRQSWRYNQSSRPVYVASIFEHAQLRNRFWRRAQHNRAGNIT
jgi:hypothetical protein